MTGSSAPGDQPPGSERDLLAALQGGQLTYEEAKRRYQQLGEAIQRRYEREFTAVSVDVVSSRRAKDAATALDAQLTFDAYHRWVNNELASHASRTGSWSGDGLLALFENPQAAILFAQALVDGIPMFNERFNRLAQPIQIRVGVHTGKVLPAEAQGPGLIASKTFDLAGHLQKAAAANQVLISGYTLGLLGPAAEKFVPTRCELFADATCYAYPPFSVHIGDPAAPAAPRAADPAPPATRPLLFGAGAALLALLLGAVFFLAFRPSAAPSGSPARLPVAPIVIGDAAAPPASDPAETADPKQEKDEPEKPPPANAPRPAAPAPDADMGAAPGGNGQPAPAATPWRSAAAASGVPVQLNFSAPEQRWALCIGAGNYADTAFHAPGAGRDARAFAALLQSSAGVPQSNIRLLVDNQATGAGIRDGFRWLQQQASSGADTVFLYLGGDARIVPQLHQGQAGYMFIPADGVAAELKQTALTGRDLVAWASATRSQALLLVADTPYAAGLELLQGNDPGRQFAVLGASGLNETEVRREGRAVSPLVQALFAGVQGSADLNRDNILLLEELAQFASNAVSRFTASRLNPELRTGLAGATPAIPFRIVRGRSGGRGSMPFRPALRPRSAAPNP